MNENIELVRALTDLYRFFNQRFFDAKLPKDTIITLTAEGRTRKGFYHPSRWTVRGDKKLVGGTDASPDEIVIHSELALADRFDGIAATLVHQMAHQAQERFPDQYGEPSGNIDTSTHYHNRAWHWLMRDRLGLKTDDGPKGETIPTPMFRAILREFPSPRSWIVRAPSEVKAPTKMLLWRCKCTRVRCATSLDAECHKCGQPFKLQRASAKDRGRDGKT